MLWNNLGGFNHLICYSCDFTDSALKASILAYLYAAYLQAFNRSLLILKFLSRGCGVGLFGVFFVVVVWLLKNCIAWSVCASWSPEVHTSKQYRRNVQKNMTSKCPFLWSEVTMTHKRVFTSVWREPATKPDQNF